jgi:hypothetical protein
LRNCLPGHANPQLPSAQLPKTEWLYETKSFPKCTLANGKRFFVAGTNIIDQLFIIKKQRVADTGGLHFMASGVSSAVEGDTAHDNV